MNSTRIIAAATIAVLALTLLTGTPAIANEPLPVLAGHTVITVEGNGGVRLHNPNPLRVDIHTIDIQAGEGVNHFLVRMVSPDCPEAQDSSRWCNGYTAAQWPHFEDDPWRQFPAFESSTHNTPDDLMPPGPVDVYVVSDGPLTITADFEGLTGSTEVAADGAISAIMEVMEPAGCNEALFGDCSRFGAGGATHALTDGFAFSVGYAQTHPMQRTTMQGDGSLTHSVNGDSCIYTAADGQDTAPDSYDQGCDLSPITVDGRNHLRRVVLQGVGRSTEIGWVNERGGVVGDAYVGFRGYSINPESVDEGAVGGLGVWVERGIGQ